MRKENKFLLIDFVTSMRILWTNVSYKYRISFLLSVIVLRILSRTNRRAMRFFHLRLFFDQWISSKEDNYDPRDDLVD